MKTGEDLVHPEIKILMVGVILYIVLALTGLALFFLSMRKVKRKYDTKISFKEAMDLTELPVVTFYNNGQKLNFLLDTGSNDSHISMEALQGLKYEKSDQIKDLLGIEGSKKPYKFCCMTITYKNYDFKSDFSITDLKDAFDAIKQESGVQIHGILGSTFFQKYKYILDFDSLIAYLK